MGNKYHVLHRHLSRLSRPDDLGLGVAVPSIHPAAEKRSFRKLSIPVVLRGKQNEGRGTRLDME